MPGTRSYHEKTRMVQFRMREEDHTRWAAHVEKAGGYLSVLIRRAVDEHIAAQAKAKKPPALYEWPARY